MNKIIHYNLYILITCLTLTARLTLLCEFKEKIEFFLIASR